MWMELLRSHSNVLFKKKNILKFFDIYKKYNIKEVEKNKKLETEFDIPYIIYLIKKYEIEKKLALVFTSKAVMNFINNFTSTKMMIKLDHKWYYSNLQTTYQRFIGCENWKTKFKLDLVVFDLKKKQLYSSYIKNNLIKNFLTNGILLRKLSILDKNKKKHISAYAYNIKKFFYGELKKKELIIEIAGAKSYIFKIIKFIKKYYKLNFVFIFTPRISFFKNQYKKLRSIKKKTRKHQIQYLKF